MSKLTRKSYAFEREAEAYKRMQEAQQKAEEEAQYKPAPETDGQKTQAPKTSGTKKQPQKKVDASISDFRKEYLKLRNTKTSSSTKSRKTSNEFQRNKQKANSGEPNQYDRISDAYVSALRKGNLGTRYQTANTTNDERLTRTFQGMGFNPDRVRAEKEVVNQNQQAAKRKEAARNARNALAADNSAREAANRAVADQNRQAQQRKEAEQNRKAQESNAKNRNQMDETYAGRSGGSYSNPTPTKPTTREVLTQGFDSVKLGGDMGGKKTTYDGESYSYKPKTSSGKQTVVRSTDKRTEEQKKNSFGAYVRSKKGN